MRLLTTRHVIACAALATALATVLGGCAQKFGHDPRSSHVPPSPSKAPCVHGSAGVVKECPNASFRHST
jgi:hypothetical protein